MVAGRRGGEGWQASLGAERASGTGLGGRRGRGSHQHADALRGLARARVHAGVLRPRGGRPQARGEAAGARGLAGRPHVGRRRRAVQPPLGALLHPQRALHGERRALVHRQAALRLVRRACARHPSLPDAYRTRPTRHSTISRAPRNKKLRVADETYLSTGVACRL